jgi:uncharacterized membrane protein
MARSVPPFELRRAPARLVISLGVGALAAWFARHLGWTAQAVAAWDGICVTELVLAWRIIVSLGPDETRAWATGGAPGKLLELAFIICAGALSLFLSIFLLHQAKAFSAEQFGAVVAICLIAVVGTWLLAHVSYGALYARLYYQGGGLEFPGGQAPNYWDFVYFSFTMGMCFQTSDVTISSPSLRRLGIIHAVISFGFNTTILALMINLVAGMIG